MNEDTQLHGCILESTNEQFSLKSTNEQFSLESTNKHFSHKSTNEQFTFALGRIVVNVYSTAAVIKLLRLFK